MAFSDYIVYVDESGDHGLKNINPSYPLFVLAFCIFKKSDYIEKIVPAFQKFKFRYWGHDATVLHEHDIRKARSAGYEFLNDPILRQSFVSDLNQLMEDAPFHVVAMVINKVAHRSRYTHPKHPYHLSLHWGLERLLRYLKEQGVDTKKQITHVIVESRGAEEDKDLAAHFQAIIQAEVPTYMNAPVLHNAPFSLKFASKSSNSIGLQLADLLARPIGLHVLRPEQENRAFSIIKPKLFEKNGTFYGHGLKIFP